ncbi:hypothetical protein B0H10DRAFT_1942736 [Mycena sp. CBHHK59/15]|nr:hypothetical protein B0H10DRAFT_1942736 [Mycena sp. CBHHK59/15]
MGYSISFGIVADGVERYHGLDCAMVVFSDNTTYGKVLEYSEHLGQSDERSLDGAILEMQSKLMNFLLAVVTKILTDLNLSNLMPATPLSAPVIPILSTTLHWQSSARANSRYL